MWVAPVAARWLWIEVFEFRVFGNLIRVKIVIKKISKFLRGGENNLGFKYNHPLWPPFRRSILSDTNAGVSSPIRNRYRKTSNKFPLSTEQNYAIKMRHKTSTILCFLSNGRFTQISLSKTTPEAPQGREEPHFGSLSSTRPLAARDTLPLPPSSTTSSAASSTRDLSLTLAESSNSFEPRSASVLKMLH